MPDYKVDSLVTRYLASREQDNEKIADDEDMLAAQRADDQDAINLAAQTAQDNYEASLPKVPKEPAQPEVKPAQIPDAQLPDAKGEVKDISGAADGLPGPMGFEPDTTVTPNQEETTFQAVSRVTADVLENLPENVTVGGVTALKHAVDAVAPGWLEESDKMLRSLGMEEYVDETNKYFNDTIRNADTADKVVQEMSQFMLPFSVYMKAFGSMTKMGTVSNAFAADAVTSFFNVDPHIERLSKVAHEMGIESDLVTYLASESGTETENRFRNVVENQAIGGAIYAAAKTLKGVWWASKKAKAQFDEVGAEEFFRGPEALREKGAVIMRDHETSIMDAIKAAAPDVDARVMDIKDDSFVLSKIEVPEDIRGQGKARDAMEAMIKYADDNGMKIALSPSADFGASKSKLTKFYKSLGFVDNKGKNKDFRFQETLIRYAKGGDA
jgi:predicted GNAT family acetyltransferase